MTRTKLRIFTTSCTVTCRLSQPCASNRWRACSSKRACTDAVDKWLDNLAEKIGPKNGARVIARSWVDAEFEATLRKNGLEAFKQMGLADVDV